jgi:hypothetical protein
MSCRSSGVAESKSGSLVGLDCAHVGSMSNLETSSGTDSLACPSIMRDHENEYATATKGCTKGAVRLARPKPREPMMLKKTA